MRRNFKNKCAAFMACASVLGSKTSAMNANKNQVKSSQTLGAVGGATSNNNSGANSKTLKRSNSMIDLTRKMSIGTKVAIAAGCITGVGATYEILGDTLIDKAPTLLKLLKGDKMKPEESQALVDKILDVINTFETEESVSKKFENDQDIKNKNVKLKDKSIEYRKSRGEFDRMDIEAFERDEDPPEDELPRAGKEKVGNSRKRCIVFTLDYVRKLLVKVKSGESLVGIKLAFQNNGIRFTYNDGGYVAFVVKSEGVLYIDLDNDGIRFKCTLKKPSK